MIKVCEHNCSYCQYIKENFNDELYLVNALSNQKVISKEQCNIEELKTNLAPKSNENILSQKIKRMNLITAKKQH